MANYNFQARDFIVGLWFYILLVVITTVQHVFCVHNIGVFLSACFRVHL